MLQAPEVANGFAADLAELERAITTRKFDIAQDIIQKYDGLYESDVPFALLQAKLADVTGDVEKAVDRFQHLLFLDPLNEQGVAFYAINIARLGRRSEALAFLKAAYEVQPAKGYISQQLLLFTLIEEGAEAAFAVLEREAARRAPGAVYPSVLAAFRMKLLSLLEVHEIEALDRHNLLGFKKSAHKQDEMAVMYGAFEPLGDNCEFAFMQRKHGIEPLSAFRWAGVHQDDLIRMLEADLAGYENPDIYYLAGNFKEEYRLHDRLYNTVHHTGANITDLEPEEFLRRVTRRQGFLKKKFFADLRSGRQIALFKSDKRITLEHMDAIEREVLRLGAQHILFVALLKERGGEVQFISPTRSIAYLSSVYPNTNQAEWDRIVSAVFERYGHLHTA